MKFNRLIIELKNNEEVVINTDTDGGSALMYMLDGMLDSSTVYIYRELNYINDDNEIDFRYIKSQGDLIDSISNDYVKLDDVKDYYLVEADSDEDEDEEA